MELTEGTNTNVIETPVKDAKQRGPQTARAPTRFGGGSTAFPWQQIFKHRFLLTTASGEIRAVIDDSDAFRVQRE